MAGHDAVIPRLIHLNGPPAVGKSSIATALAGDHPLTLALDIDDLRVRLGGWRDQPDSKRVARTLGFAMAGQHLSNGYDVLLPQLVVRREVVEEIEKIASGTGAEFIELILFAPADEVRARLAASSGGASHPRDLFAAAELAHQVTFATSALASLAVERPDARIVDVAGLDLYEAADRVRAAIAARGTSAQPS